MCGIFGAFNCDKAAETAYFGLHWLQHRAQEFAGIVTSDGHNLYRRAGPGIVQDVFDQKQLDHLHGRNSVGHIRYSTVEDKPVLDNTQPLTAVFDNREVALCHNGNLTNHSLLRARLQASGRFKTSLDTEVPLRQFCVSTEIDIAHRVFDAVKNLHGSYSLLWLFDDVMVAVRDPWGNRPLALGRRGESWFVSSESVAFDNLDVEFIRDIAPGEILIIDKGGLTSWYFDETTLDGKPIIHQRAHCVFELVYFAHPASVLDGVSVADFRIACGRALQIDQPAAADIVVAVPDSANYFAQGFAESQRSGRLELGLLRSHYIGRTFIDPLPEQRSVKVLKKFMAVGARLWQKAVVLAEDSIVRLTTLPPVIHLLKRAGVVRIHVRVGSPPIIAPCFHGIDMPTREELIAADHAVQEIREIAGADSLSYLPLAVLKEQVPHHENYCFACMTGQYPIPLQ